MNNNLYIDKLECRLAERGEETARLNRVIDALLDVLDVASDKENICSFCPALNMCNEAGLNCKRALRAWAEKEVK